MQPLADQSQPLTQDRICAVQRVTNAGMVDGSHVDPDLMGPAGLQMHLEQRGTAVGLHSGVVGDRMPTGGHHRHLPVVASVTPDRSLDSSP